jgi:hypothetical protein
MKKNIHTHTQQVKLMKKSKQTSFLSSPEPNVLYWEVCVVHLFTIENLYIRIIISIRTRDECDITLLQMTCLW